VALFGGTLLFFGMIAVLSNLYGKLNATTKEFKTDQEAINWLIKRDKEQL
jgi:hypothetical protein